MAWLVSVMRPASGAYTSLAAFTLLGVARHGHRKPPSTSVTVRDEGHGRDSGREILAPHPEQEFGSFRHEVLAHVAHGDRSVQGGRKAAGGNVARGCTVQGDDL